MTEGGNAIRGHDSLPRSLVLRGGTVLDGSGRRPHQGDVHVASGIIRAVSDLDAGLDPVEIDCEGLCVAPGFIDAHSHADFTLPNHPAASALLEQGVTTVVTGNCGFSPFPWPDAMPNPDYPGSFFNPTLSELWPDLDSYRSALENLQVSVNLVPLVGHGSTRAMVLSSSKLQGNEKIDLIIWNLLSVLNQGAFGVSLGLAYPEGRHADSHELERVACLVAQTGAVLSVHLRNERDGCPDAVEEVLGLARQTGVRLQISHLKAMGRENWGTSTTTLSLIDEALAEGADVGIDMYPYASGATKLSLALPHWADELGSAHLRSSLGNGSVRDRLIRELGAGEGYVQLEEVRLSSLSKPWRHLEGTSLVDAAADIGSTPAELLLDILADDGSATMLVEAMADDDVNAVLRHRSAIVGSDGWILQASCGAHPRNFNTFVRTLIRSLDEPMQLADTVRRQTSAVARRFGVAGRGSLVPGSWADIVVFDPNSLTEGSYGLGVNTQPTGIRHVLVNGRVVHGPYSDGLRSGRVLSRQVSEG